MKVVCQNCGAEVIVSGLGRKAFNMPVTKVCDALLLRRDVPAAAEKLGCDPAYIYKVLKAKGLTAKDIIKK